MKNSRPSFLNRKGSGFTLVELLAAMAVLTVMIAIFAQAVGGITRAWSSAQQRMDNYTKARALLSRLQVDVDGIVARPDLVAFPENGSVAPTQFGFYTLRRGVDESGTTDGSERSLSYVTYELDKENSDYPDRLLRSDKRFSLTDTMKFADPGEPVNGDIGTVPIPPVGDAPPADTDVAVSDGVLDFRWAFLGADGKLSEKFYTKDKDGNDRPAIGVAVAMLVMDEKSASTLKDVGAFGSLVNQIRNLNLEPDSQGLWNPKLEWEEKLGLRVGGDASLIANIPQKRLLGGIRAFQRMYFFN